jgi:hypothetical protein
MTMVKVKLFLWFLTEHHALKAYWGSGGIAPCILDLRTRWKWVVSFTPQLLYPQGKCPRYPLDRRLGGPQSQSGCGGKEKISQPLPGLEPPIIQPIAQCYTTELSQLLTVIGTRVYPKVSGLAAWSENCKCYSSLPLGAVVSLFCESV